MNRIENYKITVLKSSVVPTYILSNVFELYKTAITILYKCYLMFLNCTKLP